MVRLAKKGYQRKLSSLNHWYEESEPKEKIKSTKPRDWKEKQKAKKRIAKESRRRNRE